MSDKSQLRKKILAKRDALKQSQKSVYDAEIVERFIHSDLYGKSRTVFTYLNFKSEPETLQLAVFMVRAGKRVCVPYIENEQTGEMSARQFVSLSSAEYGKYGILTSKPSSSIIAPEEIDVVIAPGAVFDRAGNRIGYGGGYYDHFFTKLNSGCIKTAFAYDFQIVNELAPAEHDLPVDQLFTERGHYCVRNRE